MLLDEPTADLDRATERLVRERLAVSLQGRTVVETSHRLHTTLNADLVVLVAGAVVDVGPPDQVRSRPGYYAEALAAETADDPRLPRRSRPMTQRNRPMTDLRWLLAFAAPAPVACSPSPCSPGSWGTPPRLRPSPCLPGRSAPRSHNRGICPCSSSSPDSSCSRWRPGPCAISNSSPGIWRPSALLGELRIWVMHRVLPQAPAVIDVRERRGVLDVAVRDVDRIECSSRTRSLPRSAPCSSPAAAIGFTAATAGPPTALSLALVLAAGWAVSLLGRGAGRQAARVLRASRAVVTQHVADSTWASIQVLYLEERLAAMRELDARLGAALTARSRRAGVRHGATALRVWGGTLLRAARRPRDSTRSAAGRAPGGRAGAGHRDRTGHPQAARHVPSPPVSRATRRVRELAEACPLVPEPSEPTAPTEPARRYRRYRRYRRRAPRPRASVASRRRPPHRQAVRGSPPSSPT